MTDQSQIEFEAWAATKGMAMHLARGESGQYVSRVTQNYMDCWQASQAWQAAEVEALRKDAERYRWLRVKQTFIWLIQDWFPKDNVLTDVDAEIDAAMSKEPSQ